MCTMAPAKLRVNNLPTLSPWEGPISESVEPTLKSDY